MEDSDNRMINITSGPGRDNINTTARLEIVPSDTMRFIVLYNELASSNEGRPLGWA